MGSELVQGVGGHCEILGHEFARHRWALARVGRAVKCRGGHTFRTSDVFDGHERHERAGGA